MGNRKRRTTVPTREPQQQAHLLERDYVAEVQRRVAHLTRESECASRSFSGNSVADKQLQRVEKEMASLRAEALKARRLAEQIENLSRATTRPIRNSVMTESSTTSARLIEQQSRRKADTSKSSSQLSFNPLHPSMELPPEQLIRLLGLETKKIRKGKKVHAHAPATKPLTGAPPSDNRREQPVAAAPLIPSATRHSRIPSSDVGAKPRGILFRAVAIGVVAGAAAAGYLFLSQPPIATTPPVVAETGSVKMPDPQPQSVASDAQTRPQPDRSGTATPRTEKPLSAPAAATGVAIPPPPERQAAIEAELAKLRAEAKSRLAQQMSQIEARRESQDLQAPAVDEGSPADQPNPPKPDPAVESEAPPMLQEAFETGDPEPPSSMENTDRDKPLSSGPPGAESPEPFPEETLDPPFDADPGPQSSNEGAALTLDDDLQESLPEGLAPSTDPAGKKIVVDNRGQIIRQLTPEPATTPAPEAGSGLQSSAFPENQPSAVTETGSF